jgi:hypothetical protein
MTARAHAPSCIDHSGESSDESENGSNNSDDGSSDGLANSEENESGGSNNGSSDSESGVDDYENPSGVEDKSQSTMEWIFNKALHRVHHNVVHCHECNEFAGHYSGAMARLDPSYDEACLAQQHVIGEDLEKQIDGYKLELKKYGTSIPRLQDELERVREETLTARVGLRADRKRLEEARLQLEEARRDRAAAKVAKGSYIFVSNLSQHPRPSQSPSPRPHKSLRRAPTDGI